MKTIRAIIFGALVVIAFVSGLTLFFLLGAVDTKDLWWLTKVFLSNITAFWLSVSALTYLYERWYQK